MQAALRDFFGGNPPGYAQSDVLDPDAIIQLGVAPVRIDILSRIDGQEGFSKAWRVRVEGPFGPVQANYLSLEDLIAAKTAAGREQDRADTAPHGCATGLTARPRPSRKATHSRRCVQ